MVKFVDSQALLYGAIDGIATSATDEKNGAFGTKIGDVFAAPASTALAQAGVWLVDNVDVTPETDNTVDQKTLAGDKLRLYKLADRVNKEIEISSAEITTDYSTVAEGDYLIPVSGSKLLSKRVAETGTYVTAFLVKEKNTFGNFVIDGASTTAGGVVCEIVTVTFA